MSWPAVDCGNVIDADSVKRMVEGAANFGLSAALTGEITIANGAVQQTNFDGYRPLRMSAAPAMEVHIVGSHESPAGMGEPGVPPIAPAVANGIFARPASASVVASDWAVNCRRR